MPRGTFSDTAIRSRPGSRAAAAAQSVPAAASPKSAVSRTPRVRQPVTDSPFQPTRIGSRSRCGLRPKSPHAADGIRIEPAPSVPSAAAASPAATAVPDPPLEPPLVRAGSHGLTVAPKASDSVAHIASSSGTFVLPRITQPAARSRATTSESSAHGSPECASEPRIVTCPATSVSSLIAIGTPLSGGTSPPAARRASAASASASASSASTTR